MAKARKTKAKKAKRATTARKGRPKTKARRPAARKAKPKSRPKSAPGGIMDEIAKASKVVTDTIEETNRLRREKRYPGMDEG